LSFPTAADAPPRSVRARIRRRARAHSHVVKTLRWVLPSMILALLGLLGAFVVTEAMRTAAARPKEIPTQIRMINPHFVGRDNQGRAFDLSASRAVRDDANMQRVILGAPVIILDTDGQTQKTLTADRGVYDEDTRLLKLVGHVRVDDAEASTVATNEALVDTKAGTVSGVGAISGAGPSGAISAKSYTASEKGGHVTLSGGVHAVLKGR
jgi:lipopolysaccharide export system protein LptC